jgi:hypothetical protein
VTRWRIAAALALALGAAGCSRLPDAPPQAYPVRGKVVLADGQPLRGGRVVFHPRTGGKEAVAELGADGSFTLTSFKRDDGALPGDYVVTVIPYTYKTGNPVAVPQEAQVPQRYWEPETSPLTATVRPELTDVGALKIVAR